MQRKDLNQLIENCELGHMETDRPAPISKDTLSSGDNRLKQKGIVKKNMLGLVTCHILIINNILHINFCGLACSNAGSPE